jgi:hypothetical protein
VTNSFFREISEHYQFTFKHAYGGNYIFISFVQLVHNPVGKYIHNQSAYAEPSPSLQVLLLRTGLAYFKGGDFGVGKYIV